MLPIYFEPKKSFKLYGLKKEFDFLKSLYLKKSLPKVLMISGHKGIGKFTLVNHLINFIFNKTNYNEKNNEFDLNSNITVQISNNLFPNVILLSGIILSSSIAAGSIIYALKIKDDNNKNKDIDVEDKLEAVNV